MKECHVSSGYPKIKGPDTEQRISRSRNLNFKDPKNFNIFSDWCDSHIFDRQGQKSFWFWPNSNYKRSLGWNCSILWIEERQNKQHWLRPFLKWQPSRPFPYNGHLLCCVNIPTVLLMFFNKFANCSIPCFNWGWWNRVHVRSEPQGTLVRSLAASKQPL